MSILKFRVLCDTVNEIEVFRDITIDENDTLESLYLEVLQSFTFENDQMASFFISDEDWNKGEEVTLMDMNPEEDSDGAKVMKDTLIKDIVDSPRQRLILVYDFLNMWIFLLELLERKNGKLNKPETTLAVGNIPEDLKKEKTNDISFDTEQLDDDYGFDDYSDDFDEEDFENIDDLDI